MFSNESKGAGNDSGERRGALRSDEIANRLYPKPNDSWRQDQPIVEVAPPAEEAVPTEEATTPMESTPEMATDGESNSERNDPVAAAGMAEEQPAPASSPALSLVPMAEPAVSEPVAAPVERLVSVISRNSVFDGNYATDGDVRVEGEVRGDITCKGHVMICDGATVNAKISATSVAVAGRLSGEVTCSERFEAQPTARITSQISTPRLVIQEGAVVDGQIRMGVQE